MECLVASPLGQWLAVGAGNTLAVWRVASWQPVAQVTFPSVCQALDFEAAERWLAAGLRNGSITILDSSTWQKSGEVTGLRGAVTQVTFCPGGKELVAATSAGEVVLCNAVTGEVVWKTKPHGKAVHGFGIDPRTRTVCSIDAGGQLSFTDWSLGKVSKNVTFPLIHEVYSADFCNSARLCCVGAKRLIMTIGGGLMEEERIHVLDYEGNTVAVLQGEYDRFISPLAISADGALVAGPCYRDHLIVWEVGAGAVRVIIDNIPPPKALTFSAGVGPLYLAAAVKNTVRIFGLATGDIAPPVPPIQIVVLSPKEFAGERDIAVVAAPVTVEGVVAARQPVAKLLANGAEVPLQMPSPEVTRRFVTQGTVWAFRCSWDPERDEELVLKAETVNGQSAEKVLRRTTGKPTLASAGRGWAVVIGVSEYEDPKVKDLRFCDEDAQAVWQQLTGSGRGGFEPRDGELLTTSGSAKKPTAANIRAALEKLSQASTEDRVVFFFAGHGFINGGKAYLAGCDLSLKGPTGAAGGEGAIAQSFEIGGGAIEMAEVRQRLQACPSQHKIIVVDACHSGGIVEGTAGEMSAIWANALFQGRGTAILTSCDVSESSYEFEEMRHGAFSYWLLDGFAGKSDRDGDGIITAHEAFVYASDQVRMWAQKRGYRQTPRLLYDVVEDIPVLRVARG
ncbi:MAG: caspase family protein [Armatimonadetes bacterium]|nr:caspase family protein [Armatimonadota bacterium]